MRPRGLTHDFPFCEAFEWIQRSPVGAFMQSSRVIFPIFESIHLIGLALFVGTLLLTDLGLLGVAMRRQPIHQVAAALAPWTWRGFALLMLTGPLMFTAQAAKWHDNPVFWIKMLLLIIATVFQLSVRRTIVSEASLLAPAKGKLIGAVSLVLWISTGLLSKMMEFV
ncbi:MAG: DUF6644 family protein [Bryobacteraceae bacterium]|jgi:hypothetical protein